MRIRPRAVRGIGLILGLGALLLLRPPPATGWHPGEPPDRELSHGPPTASRHPVSRVHLDGPPPGHTGGFGEPTCRYCHADFPLNQPGEVLRIEGLPERYEPGSAYLLTVLLESGDMEGAGFQAALRFAEGLNHGKQAGQVRPASSRVAFIVDESTGVHYLFHSRTGSGVGPGGVASWSFEWRAPMSASPVALHVAANSANGDDSPLGDLIYIAEHRIGPAGSGPG